MFRVLVFRRVSSSIHAASTKVSNLPCSITQSNSSSISLGTGTGSACGRLFSANSSPKC